MNDAIFNSVHYLPQDSSGCHHVSPTAWYSILSGAKAMKRKFCEVEGLRAGSMLFGLNEIVSGVLFRD